MLFVPPTYCPHVVFNRKHFVYQALSNAGVDLDTWIKAEVSQFISQVAI